MILSDFVTYRKAGDYMANLPAGNYPPNEKKYLCGGTFNVSTFWYWANLPGFSGLMFWYGLDPNNNDQRCFVGVEPKFNFTYREEDITFYSPSSDIFLCPGVEFDFQIPVSRNFEKFLRNDKRGVPHIDRIVSNREMKMYNSNFLLDPFYKENHKYGMAYFSDTIEDQLTNNSFLKYFITQGNVSFLRYYLGFEETLKGKFLRLILVPVDEKGKNTEVVTKTDALFSEIQLLQKSWPPPPNS
mgnify:CR=1 FL=1